MEADELQRDIIYINETGFKPRRRGRNIIDHRDIGVTLPFVQLYHRMESFIIIMPA